MKRILLILAIIVCSLSFASAQNYLTYGQVYNFNVGDIFETQSNDCMSSVPIYNLTIVLKKWTTVTGDSIYYVDSVVSEQPWSYLGPGFFSTGRDTMMVDSLSSPALGGFYFVYGNSCPVLDTIIDSGFCARRKWLKYPASHCVDTFFEPNTSSAWVIEGCGGGYLSSGNPKIPASACCNLIYYKKGPDSCGSYCRLMGINDIKAPAASVKAYPNPNTGKFNVEIENINGDCNIEVDNVLGEKVYSTLFHNNNSPKVIDITCQPSGVYFVKLLSDKDVQIIKVVK